MTYTQPILLMCLLVISLGMIRLRRCKGIWLSSLGCGVLWLVSLPAGDWLLSRPMEARYPVKPFSGGDAQVIVVPAGGVYPPRFETPFALPDLDSYVRCHYAAWLFKHWRNVPILASGGRGPTGDAFSETMRELLQQEGVPESMIWTEKRSQSTHENAVYCAELLHDRGIQNIVLVVEGQSMLRAESCFRNEGLVVIPAPAELRQFGPLKDELMPSWKAIRRNEGTLHEALGLAWYWIHGWI
jgi:uncharacterized SAM-binding protein YcdF (DUF218 family)